ncbi:MAG: large-conductance mechanosensitive channel protein MscL [Anaerolineae bacterium]|nr:large-conductance mechanosensitive channel protein MscL [Anaerolineae bacterium]NUQ02988.1 large-conductance mechanosensitive channel protein MscL [Anaerolineae bacterium]
MIKEFREFIMRGNVLDLAVGIIIGGAFGAIVTSLVNDIIMPPIGFFLSGIDFSEIAIKLGTTTAADGTVTDVVIGIGKFINATISFLIVAFVVFLIVRAFNEMKRRTEKPAAPAAPAGPTQEQLLTEAIKQLNETIKSKM